MLTGEPIQLVAAEQDRLGELLAQNAKGQLAADATATLDRLLAQVDHLNLLKAKPSIPFSS